MNHSWYPISRYEISYELRVVGVLVNVLISEIIDFKEYLFKKCMFSWKLRAEKCSWFSKGT